MDIQLDDIQKTLLMPLYGRARLSMEGNTLLMDNMAVEIVKKINFDFSFIEENTSYAGHIYYSHRARIFDDSILNCIKHHPGATIVNLGSGLDTTFSRVDNNLINWYDIDLPDVIDLRSRLIPETERSKYIKASIFDMDWMQAIKPAGPVLFICAGVFEYFEKDRVMAFLIQLAQFFPGSEIIFNTTSNNIVNAYFIKKGFKKMGVEATPTKMGNIINNIKRSKDKMTIVEYYPMAARIELKDILNKKTRKQLKNFYLVMQAKIIHLRLVNAGG